MGQDRVEAIHGQMWWYYSEIIIKMKLLNCSHYKMGQTIKSQASGVIIIVLLALMLKIVNVKVTKVWERKVETCISSLKKYNKTFYYAYAFLLQWKTKCKTIDLKDLCKQTKK